MNRKLIPAIAISLAIFPIKLPYEAGQRFVVVQGYSTAPTHVRKDLYAIDFSQGGCDAYGRFAVASAPGTVMLAQEAGYNGGYGTQVLIIDESRIVARYAHLIPGSVTVAAGDAVARGEPLGTIGNTGLVAGAACPTHPGTHLHFAMYGEAGDGSFVPFLPEPISQCVGITAGRWYLSDNELAITTVPGVVAILDRAAQVLLDIAGLQVGTDGVGSGAVLGASSTSVPSAGTGPTQSTSFVSPGGVSQSPSPAPQTSPLPLSENIHDEPTVSSSSSAPTVPIVNATFNSTTLAIDLSWQAATGTASSVYAIFSGSAAAPSSSLTIIATTTAKNFSYLAADSDFGSALQFAIALSPEILLPAGTSSLDFATLSTVALVPSISLPDWGAVIQPHDDVMSNASWYSDTWYNLGTGFYATVRSLTLEGFVSHSEYRATHLYLDEYIDAAYTRLNQTWTLSDNAPFTHGLRRVTIGGLDIPLQPNKYYRLRSYQEYQNRSLILAGTSATGTAMWNEFIGGTGLVEHTYPFYPYLSAIMIPRFPPLAPPVPIATMAATFDSLNSAITLSWPATTDPDTTSSLLAYQINIASSSGSGEPATLDPAAWQSVGNRLQTTTPVVFGNSYLIGLRAVDDLGNTSTPFITPWHFPAGYFPIPQQLDRSVIMPGGDAQSISVPAPITVSSIAFVVKSDPNSAWCCAVSVVKVRADASGTLGAVLATSNQAGTGHADPPRELTYTFTPKITLPAGTYWFQVGPDDTPQNAPTMAFGSASDTYPDGHWITAPDQDAYFRIQE